VLIPDRMNGEEPDIERAVLGAEWEVIAARATTVDGVDDELWNSATAILAWHDLEYGAPLIAKMHNCKVIVRVGAGYDNVDLAAAGRRGIPVCNVPDYGICDVADHAIALMLSVSRGIVGYDARARESNEYWRWETTAELRRLAGSVFGVIGLGRIGIAAARRAQSFGMRVWFYDPYLPDGIDKALGIDRASTLAELLGTADVVSVHTPLTPETRNLANAEFFRTMKPGSVFVNTARGKIVDLGALEASLRSGHLRAAALDVLPEEPPTDNPIILAWRGRETWLEGRLVITPHSAFYCRESYEEMRRKAAQAALAVLRGEFPRNCVNLTELAAPSIAAPA
jgi:phosphoglycerate dehydrogenase-like enzyme